MTGCTYYPYSTPNSFVLKRSSPFLIWVGIDNIWEKASIWTWEASMRGPRISMIKWPKSTHWCLSYGMLEESNIFLQNLSFPSDSRLMEVAKHINKSMRRTSKSTYMNCSNPLVRQARRRRPVIATLEENKGTRPSSSKRPSFNKKILCNF